MAEAARERIVLADDHPVFRDGLRRIILGTDPTVAIAEAGSFDQVLERAREGAEPDAFVLDMIFPGFDPRSSLATLRREFPSSTIIMVSMVSDSAVIQHLIHAGADGFVGKSLPAEDMARAIQSIRQGLSVIAVSPDSALDEAPAPCATLQRLTPRQLEVLSRLAEGCSNKEIARDLGISPFTVRIHVSAVLHALKVQTRAAAASWAGAAGLQGPNRGANEGTKDR